MSDPAARHRFRGCLLGLAAGDALGTTLEFKPPGSFEPIEDTVGGGPFKDRDPPDIRGTGYVVDALEAALWAFHRADSFDEGALLAVNLGDDADTTGAIYGQIAGACYGADAIPATWRNKLAMADEISSLADRLHDHAAGA